MLFFGIFYYELGRNSSERFFFVFFFLSFSAFPNLFWLGKKQHWCFLIFLNFFANFFWIFYYGSGRNSLERFSFFLSYSAFPNLCSLFLGLPLHILPWKEAIIVFSIFLNFFTIFLEFSITNRVGNPRNDFFLFFYFFYFLSFSAIPNLFWLEMLPKCWF